MNTNLGVVVIGAGAMGCFFAARLAETGHRVSVVDVDAARLAAIAGQGLALEDDGGARTVHVGAITAAQLSGPADLLIVFTKGMHTASAIAAASAAIGPDTAVVTLQNGLGNAEVIAHHALPRQIVFGVTDLPADFHTPNRVSSHGAGKIALWSMIDAATPAVERAHAALTLAGFAATIDPQTQARVWEKLAFNAALNPLAALLGVPVGGLNTPEARSLAARVVDEVCAVAAKLGIAPDRAQINARIDHALRTHTLHKPSMLQDVLARRATEVAFINGAVAERGEAHGVPTPLNRMLADLVRVREAVPEGLAVAG
ncbi:ketopantoate reductase family protein [Novosphingobium sp.]|uniref:ketopantoate reductase family protein n=1 Tax=Novosphingobium sp. TaxID=1874826 RepID=UPI0038B982D9